MKNTFQILIVFLTFISVNINVYSEVTYESYYNERFDFGIEYPNFLIPQPPPDNNDGNKFISKNGASSMLVFRSVKIDNDANIIYSLDIAHDLDKYQYNSDKSVKITKDEIFDNYYKFTGTKGNKHFVQITIFANENFFTILFEFKKSELKKYKGIIDYVANSFNVGESEQDRVQQQPDETISNFITLFLDDCFWGKNMNKLLVEKKQVIMKYIDPKLDVRRYYNPGAIALIYNRTNNFGFSAIDLKGVSNNNNQLKVVPFDLNSPCEFNLDGSDDGVYYSLVESVPDSIDPVNLEFYPMNLPNNYTKILKVHLVGEKIRLRTLYFVKSSESNWILAFIDDSECSA